MGRGELVRGVWQWSGSRHVYIGSNSICVIIVTNYVQGHVEKVRLVKVLVLYCPGNYLPLQCIRRLNQNNPLHPILLPQLPAKLESPYLFKKTNKFNNQSSG